MNPDRILQSDVLDIIFENRNKFYGAYELRRHYNARLKKAIFFTTIIAVLFIGLQYLHQKKGNTVSLIHDNISSVKFTPINLEEPKPKPQQPIKQKPIATLTYKTPVVVADEKVKDTVHTIAEVLNTRIGTSDINGENINILPPSNGVPTGNINIVAKKETEDETIVDHVQIMPQFPGGTAALIKFLQQNLRQPDDLQEGEKLVVIANFIIDNTGNIQNIKIEQQARPDLDAEVVRVLKRMPQWIAGVQNGRKVSVIYRLPVTFIANE